MFKLNDGMTEAIPCGAKTLQFKVSVVSICVGESEISLCGLVRDLGLLIDSNITLHHHVSAVVRTCYLYLPPFLTKKAAISVAVALVLARLDYCNSCLWGLPGWELHRLLLV